MALQRPIQLQNVEVPFGALDQKSSPLVSANGALEHAINVEFDKVGVLNKRRGYQFVDTTEVVSKLDDVDDVVIAVTTHRNELLVVTYDRVLALGSKDMALMPSGASPAAFVYRGPNNRGACRLHYVSTSRTTQGSSG